MRLNLVTVPNPVLNQPTVLIKKFDKKLLGVITEMKQVLNGCKDPEGVGLAAPQVGLTLKLFLTKPYSGSQINVYINPQILETATVLSSRKDTLEGCLSVRNTWSSIRRPKWLKLRYQNVAGEARTEKFTGWEAQIIFHEMDHLNGILFTYRAMEQNKPLYRIEKNKQGKEELVPLEI